MFMCFGHLPRKPHLHWSNCDALFQWKEVCIIMTTINIITSNIVNEPRTSTNAMYFSNIVFF